MFEGYPNLQHVWKDLAAQRPDDIVIRIAVEGSQAGRTYRIGTLFRRASRLANALREQLHLQPGARTIILAEDPEEQTLAVTALWLARLVAVPVEVTAPDQALISLMAGADVKAVIFSPDSAAKVAALFGRARSVEHWIVSGNAKGVPKVPGMARLDDLISSSGVAGDNIDRLIADGDCPALVVLSSGSSSLPHGILFSQRQILAAAQAAAMTYPLPTTQQHTWVGLPLKSLTGLIHCMVVPLFTQIPCIIDSDVTMKAFWDQVAADGITTALIDYPSLKVLHRRGLPKRVGGAENLTVRVFLRPCLSRAT